MAGEKQTRMERAQNRSDTTAGEVGTAAVAGADTDAAAKHAQLKEEIDDLLDEIDAVLETNAEEFVHGYVQKGGE